MFRNMVSFYGGELLAPRPTTKLEDQHFSAVRDRLFILAATLRGGGRLLHPQLMMRHAVVTGTHNTKCYLAC